VGFQVVALKLWAFGLLRVFAFIGLGLASSQPENTPSGANFQCSNILSSVKSMQYRMGAKLPRWVDLIEHYQLPPKTDRTGQWENPSLNVWSSNRELADGSSKIGGVEMSEFALLHILNNAIPLDWERTESSSQGFGAFWVPCTGSVNLFPGSLHCSCSILLEDFHNGLIFHTLLPSQATVMSPRLLIIPFAIAVTIIITTIDLIVIIVPLLMLCPSSLSSFKLHLLPPSPAWPLSLL